MVTSVHDPDIERDCTAAAEDGYSITSEEDANYNCIAWATGESETHWWPFPGECSHIYWPEGVPFEETVEAFLQAYQTRNWVDCGSDGSVELGFEKLAIYVGANNRVQHAARQLENGDWTSKLGLYKDISHTSPAGLAGSLYGKPVRYMKRPIREES